MLLVGEGGSLYVVYGLNAVCSYLEIVGFNVFHSSDFK